MDDLRSLEAQASRDPTSVDTDTHDRLAHYYWDQAQSQDDFRKRLKLLKRATFFVENAVEMGVEAPDTLRVYRDILSETADVHNSPQSVRRTLSRVSRLLQKAAGADGHHILASVRGTIGFDGATVMLGDVGAAPSDGESPTPGSWDAWMAEGKRLGFETGFDGSMPAELRLIDSPEPVLADDEFDKSVGATLAVVLAIPTGRVGIAGAEYLNEVWPPEEENWFADMGFEMHIEPGRYKACAFGFYDERLGESVVCVLCPTDEEPINEAGSIAEIFG